VTPAPGRSASSGRPRPATTSSSLDARDRLVVEKINEPRYPSFKGIMAAKKKPLTNLTIADAGIDPAQVGLASAPSQVVEFANKPPRSAGQIVKDEGDGGIKIADFLSAQKLV
jgi:electron transfer flavoprotein beta subunit